METDVENWRLWKKFRKNKISLAALILLSIIALIGIYAPFFASSKPILVFYNDQFFFPLFRYLFFRGFFTKPIDLFFNVLMFLLPITLGGAILFKKFQPKILKPFLFCILAVQLILTFIFIKGVVKDPERNLHLVHEKELQGKRLPDFDNDLTFLNDYQKLNSILRYKQKKEQKKRLSTYATTYLKETHNFLPILYELDLRREADERANLTSTITALETDYKKALEIFPTLYKEYLPYEHQLTIANMALKEAREDQKELLKQNYERILEKSQKVRFPLDEVENVLFKYRYANARLNYLEKKHDWVENELKKMSVILAPLLRPFHWEEDAGGGQEVNPYLPWFERTRINRKDLTSALIFGIRISLLVGFSAVLLSLVIGVPLGLFAAYFAGKTDMITLRFIEIWEAMPTFFTLLLISAILHSKSLFLTVLVLGLFGWTGFARYIRAEVLRERNLPYVMASKSLGFRHPTIMFSHILPNAIFPVLALLPFSMMGAITSEAGLSFLGLGEEGSTSWGVLMSEARSVFPGESYLLWPPALLLTLLLVSIALVGDGLRDALDPKT